MNIKEFETRVEEAGVTLYLSRSEDGRYVNATILEKKDNKGIPGGIPAVLRLTIDASDNILRASDSGVKTLAHSVRALSWLGDLCTNTGLELKIKYFTDEIEELRYIDGKSDWIDLRAAQKMELKAGEFKLIPLGIAMQLPDGYEAHVVPRSSTFSNYGIVQTNSMGIIDETYCGDNDQWFFPAYAVRDTVINVNDRICQFRVERHQPELYFNRVKQLLGNDRGGHGSTGKQ